MHGIDVDEILRWIYSIIISIFVIEGVFISATIIWWKKIVVRVVFLTLSIIGAVLILLGMLEFSR